MVSMRTLPYVGVALALLASGCTDNQDEDGAKKLWAGLEGAHYETWARPPNYEGPKASFTAHAERVEIFLNASLAKAVDDRKPLPNDEWPQGSLVVKRGYTSKGKLLLVAAMEKRPDGWAYYEFDCDGKPLFSGHPKICLDCHAKGADKIWSFGFPR